MFNTVNADNFNQTLDGYVIRACKDMNLTQKEFDRIMSAIDYAKDMMTMEDARKEYDKYYNKHQIQFKQDND